jgi:hypothetical protein
MSQRHSPGLRLRISAGRGFALFAVLALLAAACGASAAGDGDADAACDAFVAIDEASFAEDPEGVIAALEDFVAAAPDDVASAVEPLIPIFDADPEAAEESDELAVAEAASDGWAWDNCADSRFEAEAHNFAFTGIPSEVDAGRVAFSLTNHTQTGEFHEALVLRKNDDATGAPSELMLEGIGDVVSIESTFGSFEHFALLGGSFVGPEDEDVYVVDLDPGEYLIVCMLPVNSPELLEQYFSGEEVDSSYHASQGMFVELIVR